MTIEPTPPEGTPSEAPAPLSSPAVLAAFLLTLPAIERTKREAAALAATIVTAAATLPELCPEIAEFRATLRSNDVDPRPWSKAVRIIREACAKAAEAARAEGQRPGPRVAGPDDLPVIRTEIGKPQDWIAASVASLGADADMFVRDAELVHVTRITEEESAESEWTDARGRTHRAFVAGSPHIHTMTLPTLRVRMARWASWTKPKLTKSGWEDVPVEPTKAHAEELRDERRFPGLRRLAGIAETPFPRPDLSIVQGARRYDVATGYLYEPAVPFETIPEAPTQADARASYEALTALLVDFPFASPAGIAGAIALLLTMLARPAILGPVPAWMIDATTPGTGKTLLADVLAAIAYGRDAGRAHFPATNGRNSDEELGKRLGTFARMGLPLVCFDNSDDAVVGGDVLEEIISTPTVYTFRILGKTEGLTLPVRMIFVVTANNAAWSRGMNRRIMHVKLESPFADPEHRPLDSYVRPDRAGQLFAYAVDHRAEYVRHALTILRAYAHAGSPDPIALGTFEAWAALVPSAIVWAGGADPMLCRPGADGEESPDMLQRQTLAREWSAWLADTTLTGVTSHTMIERLYPKMEHGQPLDPKWDELRGAIEFFVPPRYPGTPPDPLRLSDAMSRRLAGAAIRTHDAPAPLRRFARDGKSGGRARWKVENVPAYEVKSGRKATPEKRVSAEESERDKRQRELVERLQQEAET